jgi:hypothetical protein
VAKSYSYYRFLHVRPPLRVFMCAFVSVHSRAPDSRSVSRDRRRMKGCLMCMWGRSATRGARARYCNSQEHLLHAKPSWRSLELEANQRLRINQSLKHNAPLRGVLFGAGLALFSFWLSVFARHHLLMFFFTNRSPRGGDGMMHCKFKKLVRSWQKKAKCQCQVPTQVPTHVSRAHQSSLHFLHIFKNI